MPAALGCARPPQRAFLTRRAAESSHADGQHDTPPGAAHYAFTPRRADLERAGIIAEISAASTRGLLPCVKMHEAAIYY